MIPYKFRTTREMCSGGAFELRQLRWVYGATIRLRFKQGITRWQLQFCMPERRTCLSRRFCNLAPTGFRWM